MRSRSRQQERLDDHTELTAPEPEPDSTLTAILKLPDRYKTPVYLYYYEGYSVREIAAMLHLPSNTVKTRLARARKQLRKELEGASDA